MTESATIKVQKLVKSKIGFGFVACRLILCGMNPTYVTVMLSLAFPTSATNNRIWLT